MFPGNPAISIVTQRLIGLQVSYNMMKYKVDYIGQP